MRILRRYILRQVFLPFILSLVVLNFIFMAGYMVKATNFIIGRGIPITDTLYVLLLALPGMVSYTVPTSILMAVLLVFGGLSQNNELRAMKASGVHLVQVLTPVFIFGVLLSFGMFVFNDQIESNASFELRKTMKRMIIKFPKALIEPGRFVKLSDNIIFLTKQVEGDELRDIVAYEVEETDKPVRTIIAERGEIVTGEDETEIQIHLYNGSISDAQDEGVHTIQFKTYKFPTFGQEDIRKMQKKKKDMSLAEILVMLKRENLNQEDVIELWSAFHQRISFSLGSFLFILLGIPIAMLVKRGEIVLSFGIAMTAASVYYIFFAGAKTIAVQGVLPPAVALWFPTVVLTGLGVYLLKRSMAA